MHYLPSALFFIMHNTKQKQTNIKNDKKENKTELCYYYSLKLKLTDNVLDDQKSNYCLFRDCSKLS